MEAEPTAPRGLVAGKYEVVRLIGRGGMGAVWEGRHATLGTRVAIKFIDQEYADSKEARSRFDTEARAAAALQSKHAIQIFDHGVTDDGRPYMVMELLLGEPLDERLERRRRIPLEEAARILSQVCRALQRAHDAGVIHRDLKPENIFLVRSPDDDEEVAKVLDFGIAKIKAPPGEMGLSSSTKTGAVLGTPYYMAPEQARGLRSIDWRADLWSLGVIAYKCVTGILPFEGESVGDLLVKICTSPAPVPSLTLPGLPPAFDAWFARTMEREPERRFTSAMELADALLLSAGMSVRRPTQPSQREPPPYAGVAPTLDSGTPLPAAGLTSAPFVTSTQPPRSSRGVLVGVVAAALVGGSVGVFGVVKLLSPASDAAKSAGHAAPPASTTAAPVPSPDPSPTEVSPPPATITIGTATPQAAVTTAPHATSWKTPPGTKPPPLPHPTASAASTTAAPHPTTAPTNKPPPATADPGY